MKSTIALCSGDIGGILSRSSMQGRCLYLRNIDSDQFSVCERVWQLAQRTIKFAALWSCVSRQGMMWAFSNDTGTQSAAQ